jgi:hypothetical protein
MTLIWHTEYCDDDHCNGECHEAVLECTDCGEQHVFEEGEKEAHFGKPCEDPECEGTLEYPSGGCDEARAERRQMGLTAL